MFLKSSVDGIMRAGFKKELLQIFPIFGVHTEIMNILY
jgi:hypothetical protein